MRPKEPIVSGPHQVTSDPKEIIDGCMDGEKLLNLPQGLEAAHVTFALSRGLMGDFGTVVGVLLGAVLDRG